MILSVHLSQQFSSCAVSCRATLSALCLVSLNALLFSFLSLLSPETFNIEVSWFYCLLKTCKYNFTYGAASQINTQLLSQQLDTLPFLQFIDYSFLKDVGFLHCSFLHILIAGLVNTKSFIQIFSFLNHWYILSCACPTCRWKLE